MGDTSISAAVKSVDKYKLINDAYYGEGGFDSGSYIVTHLRETLTNYNNRKALAYYLNYVEPIANAHVDPVFKKEAIRTTSNNIFQEFLDNVDAAGTQMHDFMKQASLGAKLNQINFIVVDNFTEQEKNVADALENRVYPFCYTITPDRVEDYKIDRFGKLIEITYTESDPNNPNEILYKTWNTEIWKVVSKKKGTDVIISSGIHGLGVLPVVAFFPRKEKSGDYKPMPKTYGMAKINRRIFNLTSEIDEALRGQTFNILVYPSNGDIKNLAVGVNNALTFDPEGKHQPGFIAPNSDPIKIQIEYLAKLISEMYRMAQLSFVTGVQDQKSGVAKQWDFETTNQSLVDLANNAQSTEERIAQIFGRYIENDIDYSVVYPESFGIVDIVAVLDEVTRALDLNIGGKFNLEIKKRLAEAMFTSDKELAAEIVSDLDIMTRDVDESEDIGDE